MSNKFVVVAALVAAILAFAFYRASQPTLAVIAISGVIDDDMASAIAGNVADINGNTNVKAVLLIVDSPGGEAFASSVVYDELSKIKVPVVGWCDSMCASGAVYALAAPSVKYIGLHTPGTAIGSVGVIAKYKRTPFKDCPPMTCRTEIYKSGAVKQANSEDHIPNEAETAALQQEVDYLAGVFFDVVAKGRAKHVNAADWAQIKTARIFFGWDGVEVGLADTVMDLDAAITKAEQLAGGAHLLRRAY